MRNWRARAGALLAGGCVALAAAGCSPGQVGGGQLPATAVATDSTAAAAGGPPLELQVQSLTDQLEHGWDIGFLPDGQVLIAERGARLSLLASVAPGAALSRVDADLSEVYVAGEGGLLGMVIHPDFTTTRQFTTCLDHHSGGVPDDIRLVTWELSADSRSATKVKDLLTGLPIAAGGRHSGCRLAIADDGALIVGTGDTAVGSIPQDRTRLGGKTLRLDLDTGQPLPDNPFIDASDPAERYVLTYGHRNIQGVAVQPGTGAIYTAEHGPSFDDEVNRIVPGANYGWDPSRGGTLSNYDETVPMTDLTRFPDAVPAIWQSGDTTQAICSATFLTGGSWGDFDQALVITALKGAKLLVIRLDDTGQVRDVTIPKQTNGAYGRLRASRIGPDGALYVTTTNGEHDQLLRIVSVG